MGKFNFRVGERQIDGRNFSDLWHSWPPASTILWERAAGEVHSLSRDEREMLQVFETVHLEILN
jgi:hypothetical protein